MIAPVLIDDEDFGSTLRASAVMDLDGKEAQWLVGVFDSSLGSGNRR